MMAGEEASLGKNQPRRSLRRGGENRMKFRISPLERRGVNYDDEYDDYQYVDDKSRNEREKLFGRVAVHHGVGWSFKVPINKIVSVTYSRCWTMSRGDLLFLPQSVTPFEKTMSVWFCQKW
jgi:hypothetical protein